MDRKYFEKEIGRFHRFIDECRKKAIEILMKLQGETEFRTDGDCVYTFIGHGEGRFETAFLKEGEPWFTIRLEDGTTRDIDFFEAVWDAVLLCDVMDTLFTLDGDDTHYDDDDDSDEDFYCSVH